MNNKKVLNEINRNRKIMGLDLIESSNENANSFRNHLSGLGYKSKSNMDDGGDLNPKFTSYIKLVSSELKKQLPDLKFIFGAGHDKWHKKFGKSRHNDGRAIDITILKNGDKYVSEKDKDILDAVSMVLCKMRKNLIGFTFIDEYRFPSAGSTGGHYHLSFSENNKDEHTSTPKFCGTLKLDSKFKFDFGKDTDKTERKKEKETSEPSVIDKLLDTFGLKELSDVDTDNPDTFINKVKDVFGDDSVEDDNGDFTILGIGLEDMVSAAKKLFGESVNNRKILAEKESKVLNKFSGDIQNGPKYHGSRPLGNWQSDNAWDLFAPANTQWNSITKGKVIRVYNTGKSSGKVYGTQVTVEGMDGFPTIFYTHLKDVTVKKGDIVDIGTPIGKISEWGQSKSTHVHVGLPVGEHIKDLLSSDYSKPKGESSSFFDFKTDKDEDETKTNKKEPDLIDKLLDTFGIKSISDIETEKDSEDFANKVSTVFGDDKVLKKDDNSFEIFGYSLDELIDKAKSLFEQRLNEEINKMKKPLK